MKILALAIGCALVAAGGIAHATPKEQDMAQKTRSATAQANHAGYGVLRMVNAKAGKVQIAHEPIAELGWPAMTMWFALGGPLPEGIRVGDAVRFELVQGENKQWLIVHVTRR